MIRVIDEDVLAEITAAHLLEVVEQAYPGMITVTDCTCLPDRRSAYCPIPGHEPDPFSLEAHIAKMESDL